MNHEEFEALNVFVPTKTMTGLEAAAAKRGEDMRMVIRRALQGELERMEESLLVFWPTA